MKKPLSHRVTQIVLAILIVILVLLGYALWRQYRYIAHSDLVSAERLQIADLRHRGPLTAGDVSYIESWMTFDYVSVVFRVPSGYLKTALNANDPLYPRLSIGHYARDAATSSDAVVAEVQDAVQSYLSSSTPQ